MPAELREALSQPVPLQRARFSLDSVVTTGSLGATRSITTTGQGQLVLPDRVELRLGGAAYETVGEAEVVLLGDRAYLRLGQQWLAFDTDQQLAQLLPIIGSSVNPERALGGATDVRRVGTETVRGAPTTVYAFTLGPAQLVTPGLPGAQAVAATWTDGEGRVWIGNDGYIYRLRSELRGRTAGGGEATAVSTVDFTDFNDNAIAVALPAGVTPAALGAGAGFPAPRAGTSPSPSPAR